MDDYLPALYNVEGSACVLQGVRVAVDPQAVEEIGTYTAGKLVGNSVQGELMVQCVTLQLQC